MLETPTTRILAVCCLLALLGGLMVTHGTVTHDPDRNHYPSNDVLHDDPDAYVGERVVLGGVAADTDPVIFSGPAGTDDRLRLALTDLESDVTRGDDLWLAGIVQSDGSVAVESAIVREPWELRYMYVISALGGLWVFLRFCRQWRLELRSLTFGPRSDPPDSSPRADPTSDPAREEGR